MTIIDAIKTFGRRTVFCIEGAIKGASNGINECIAKEDVARCKKRRELNDRIREEERKLDFLFTAVKEATEFYEENRATTNEIDDFENKILLEMAKVYADYLQENIATLKTQEEGLR